MWSVRAVAAAVAIAVVAVLAAPGSIAPKLVLAAGNCTTNGDSSWGAGWWTTYSPASEPEGASAVTTYRTAASCQNGVHVGANPPANYSGWVMVFGQGSLQYAQDGLMFDGNALGCPRHWSQYNNNFAYPVEKTGSCVGGGEVHTLKVVYLPASGKLQMIIDSTVFDTTSFNVRTAWSRPMGVEFAGEAGDPNTDIPGLSTSKFDWNTMSVQFVSNNGWSDVCGHLTLYSVVTNSRYATGATACDHDQAWTAQP